MKVNINGRNIHVAISKLYLTEDGDTFLIDRDVPKDLRKISFKRWISKVEADKKKVIIDTVCTIMDDATEAPLGTGLARQNPKDPYNKWVGKKVSFTKALMQSGHFDKGERGLLWNEFIKKYMGKKK
jgi:hypothetical protein